MISVGGSTKMPGLFDRFKTIFKELEIKTGNPFENIFYPTELKPFISGLSSTHSIALGEALKILE